MGKKIFAVPEYTTGEQIKNIRKELGMTQKEFAELVNSSKATVERWEAGRTQINGPIVLLLELLKTDKDYIEKIRIPQKVYPLRMFYMYKDKICTIIDIDEIKQTVYIKNFTDNILFRAFGIGEHPDFALYEEFLKSRCFPESRDKMKLVLGELNLPFYDPLLIIEKTEGRMAEDDFWIRIER